MQKETKVPKLFVIQGGPESHFDGPVTRLGLYNRFARYEKKQVVFVVVTKVAVLAGILYFIYG